MVEFHAQQNPQINAPLQVSGLAAENSFKISSVSSWPTFSSPEEMDSLKLSWSLRWENSSLSISNRSNLPKDCFFQTLLKPLLSWKPKCKVIKYLHHMIIWNCGWEKQIKFLKNSKILKMRNCLRYTSSILVLQTIERTRLLRVPF